MPTPVTSSSPGMVRCCSKKRSSPSQGKCGLPSSADCPPSVRSLPSAQPLLPIPSEVNTFWRSEEHTSELQSRENLVCRLLLEKKKTPAAKPGDYYVYALCCCRCCA